MQNSLERYSETHRAEALNELKSELSDFSHDGLYTHGRSQTQDGRPRQLGGLCDFVQARCARLCTP